MKLAVIIKNWLLSILILSIFCSFAFCGHVNGYYKSNGTYVQPYNRSNPNSTVQDNYSYKGNVNPYTGKVGTNKYKNNPTSEYYSGATNTSTSESTTYTTDSSETGATNYHHSSSSFGFIYAPQKYNGFGGLSFGDDDLICNLIYKSGGYHTHDFYMDYSTEISFISVSSVKPQAFFYVIGVGLMADHFTKEKTEDTERELKGGYFLTGEFGIGYNIGNKNSLTRFIISTSTFRNITFYINWVTL